MQNRSLDELAGRFLEHLEIEKNVSLLTIRNYQHYLHRFLDFCAQRFSTPGFSKEQDFVLPKAEKLDEEIINCPAKQNYGKTKIIYHAEHRKRYIVRRHNKRNKILL